MRPNALVRAIGRYLTTTTLHGFKYLYAPYSADRVAWLLSCVASACCAGVLCGVLWSRFTQVPHLLSRQSLFEASAMPLSGICLPTEVIARSIIHNIIGPNNTVLVKPLAKALLGAPTQKYKLAYIEYILQMKSITLEEALAKFSPPCSEIVARCRVNRKMVNCQDFYTRDLTPFGVCCVTKASEFSKDTFIRTHGYSLHVVINSTTSVGFSGYTLITRSKGKSWMETSTILPGYMYHAPLTYQAIVGGDSELLTDAHCNFDEAYSRMDCLAECAEKTCGCLDPLRSVARKPWHNMRVCPLVRIVCLREHDDNCDCLPSCHKVTTYMSLEYSRMNAIQYSIDPLFVGLNGSEAIVLQMSLKETGSHVFSRMPTETWLTLLSSLGGVFNMFLGVGLFSALELLYFVFVRIPIALRKSPEIEVTNANQVERIDQIHL